MTNSMLILELTPVMAQRLIRQMLLEHADDELAESRKVAMIECIRPYFEQHGLNRLTLESVKDNGTSDEEPMSSKFPRPTRRV